MGRPAIADGQLRRLPDGRYCVRFKRPWQDGSTAVVLTGIELVGRLAALIPPPRMHLVRYYVPSPLTGPPAPPVGVGRRAARPLRLASAPRSRTGPGRSVRRRGRQGQEPRHPGCTVLVTSAGTQLRSQLTRKYFE